MASILKQYLERYIPATDFHYDAYYLHTPPKKEKALACPPKGTRPIPTTVAHHIFALAHNGHLVCAIEVLAYTTKDLTTLYVSKVDTTGYKPPKTPSPVRRAIAGFVAYLSLVYRNKEGSRLRLSLFAKSQPQYLFPDSAKNQSKHIVDDGGLIKWWVKTLDLAIPESSKRYLIVPGMDKYDTRKFWAESKLDWVMGYPYGDPNDPNSSIARECIPCFPDDPKARYVAELDDNGSGATMTLSQFWTTMEFRQECSAGRMVGFISVEAVAKEGSSVDTNMEGKTLDDKQYKRAFDVLIKNDFSTDEFCKKSTETFIRSAGKILGLPEEDREWGLIVIGTKDVTSGSTTASAGTANILSVRRKAPEPAVCDGVNRLQPPKRVKVESATSTDVGVNVLQPRKKEDTPKVEAPAVNVLQPRRKAEAQDGPRQESVNVLQPRRKEKASVEDTEPKVNVLQPRRKEVKKANSVEKI
ncbi:hypothetical protein YB2330_000983 [Saitoella coloradoensis]